MKGSLVKGLMAITFLLMLPLSVKATAQTGDVIYIDGKKAAFKETMRKVYPWETFYIHGKYTINNGHRRFTFPLNKRRVKN